MPSPDTSALPLRNSASVRAHMHRTAIGCPSNGNSTAREHNGRLLLPVLCSRTNHAVTAQLLLCCRVVSITLCGACEGAVSTGYPSRIDRPCEWAADLSSFRADAILPHPPQPPQSGPLTPDRPGKAAARGDGSGKHPSITASTQAEPKGAEARSLPCSAPGD
jgi:hypothetical protein